MREEEVVVERRVAFCAQNLEQKALSEERSTVREESINGAKKKTKKGPFINKRRKKKRARIFLHTKVQKSMESNDDDSDVLHAGGEAFLFVSARSF